MVPLRPHIWAGTDGVPVLDFTPRAGQEASGGAGSTTSSPYCETVPFVQTTESCLRPFTATAGDEGALAPAPDGAAAQWESFSAGEEGTWVSWLHDPPLWRHPTVPSTSVQCVLPALGCDEVGFKEEALEPADPATTLVTMLRSQRAALGSREAVRGSVVNVPFVPGGAEWESGSTASALAAKEAASGTWLQEYKTGCVSHRIAPPGFDRGVFGSWAVAAAAPAADSGTEQETAAADTATAAAVAAHADDVVAGQQQQQEQGGQQQGGGGGEKVVLDDLFSGVWVLGDAEVEEGDSGEEEEAGEEVGQGHGPSPRGEAQRRLLDVLVPGRDEQQQEGGGTAAAGTATAAAAELRDALAPPDHPPEWLSQPSRADAARVQRGGVADTHEWAKHATDRDMAAAFAAVRPRMAREYAFELDTFQKEAVVHLEEGHSVFVAAHTSAGKTVVAEYAFALAAQHCTRAIYTSPIKTISNQKFRDFTAAGFEVGLITGDVSIKPESACLIMTTEILRSMLYKGADIIRDIEWVIFDEVHYVNDEERGVVWEEVIIMLPQHVNLVLLSATVPNVMDFADWVGRTKQKVVYVTSTKRRPVPLEHNLYYNGELYVIGRHEGFVPEGVTAARAALRKKLNPPETNKAAKAALPTGRGTGRGGPNTQQQGRGRGGRSGPSGGGAAAYRGGPPYGGGGGGGPSSAASRMRQDRQQWSAVIQLLKSKSLLPAVIFCFSKRRCDLLVDGLSSLDLNTNSERSEVHLFFDRCTSRLQEGDRQLPQILRLREMLKRGLGVHHAGLLPIMKEVVEMLFCRGLVKLLFCTETFAMGVNAPARAVVFQQLRKHDGKAFRTLLPGEYTQMAGRAGRRGLDAVGTVIVLCMEDVLPEEGDLRRLLVGSATKLTSQFRLTYSMILNLLRVEDLKIEDMLKRSFAEFHAQRSAPEVVAAVQAAHRALHRLAVHPWPPSLLGSCREEVQEYVELSEEINRINEAVKEEVLTCRAVQQQLVPGRVVLLTNQATGMSEMGVLLEQVRSGSAGAAAAGGPARGVRADLDYFGGGGGPPSGGTGAASLSSRKYVVLYLQHESPLAAEAATAAAAAAAAATAAAQQVGNSQQTPALGNTGGQQQQPVKPALDDFGPGLVLKGKKQGDDDDDDMFGGMRLTKKGGGKKGGGGGGSAATAAARAALPMSGGAGTGRWVIEELSLQEFEAVAKAKIRIDADALLRVGGEASATAAAQQLLRLQEDPGSLGLVDALADMRQLRPELVDLMARRNRLIEQRDAMPCHRDSELGTMWALVRSDMLLTRRLDALRHQLSDASLAQMPEFEQRAQVLQHLGYISEDRTVQLKGRVACEINSGDELVATELIFSGLLTDLDPEEAVALLSALVFQEKVGDLPELPSKLQSAQDSLYCVAVQAGQVQAEHGLQLVPEEYANNVLKFGLVEVVYEWARGTPFKDICGLTDVLEGSIVRAIVRLDETCREFRDAARVMGNTQLLQQMEAASAAIKRDIVFSASLYLS